MTTGTLQIHTENILPIIKKWLYSDRDVFVRELVSNACDAMQKCRVLRDSQELELDEASLKLEITVDKEQKTLTFSDAGLGMTGEEVVKYIAQIAFSGAEEFVEKYKGKENSEAIIGHFGLGFYSAYMVAQKVTIDTLSYRPGTEPALWICEGNTSYTLDVGARKERGTMITLHLDADSEEYLDEHKIRAILQRYCAFLPFPIFLNGKQVNNYEPLWLKNPADCTEEDYQKFYNFLYPLDNDPIFWIHLNVDYPFNLKGILYFPKIHSRFDWNRCHVKLFCNRVFVSDNCKDLLPEYLTILCGAIDSPDIPLNVSRSFLQMDRTVRQVGAHISKKIADKLVSLFDTDRRAFEKAWEDIEVIVKLGALQDEKFYERVKNLLIWKGLDGSYLSLEEYLDKVKNSAENKVFYSTDEKLSPSLLKLYQEKGLEILYANHHIDTALISFLESKMEKVRFQRIDGGIDPALLDASQEKTVLDENGKTEASLIADFFKSSLLDENIDVEAKSLASESLSGLIIVDESTRRLRDYMAMTQKDTSFNLGEKKTFVVNTSSRLVQKVMSLKDKNEDLAKQMAHHLFELQKLSQKDLEAKDLGAFIERSSLILEELL